MFFVQREKQERWSLGSMEFTAPPKSRLAVRWVNALQIWIYLHGQLLGRLDGKGMGNIQQWERSGPALG